MSQQRVELCERVIRVAVIVLLVAALSYLALAGMNIAVLPAAFVEAQAQGSRLIAGCSLCIMVAFLAIDALLLVGRIDRARMRLFGLVGMAFVAILFVFTIGFSVSVTDAVFGIGLFTGCNMFFALVLAGAVAAVMLVEPDQFEDVAAKAKHAGGAAKSVAGKVKSVGGRSKRDAAAAEGTVEAGIVSVRTRQRARARRARALRMRATRRLRR